MASCAIRMPLDPFRNDAECSELRIRDAAEVDAPVVEESGVDSGQFFFRIRELRTPLAERRARCDPHVFRLYAPFAFEHIEVFLDPTCDEPAPAGVKSSKNTSLRREDAKALAVRYADNEGQSDRIGNHPVRFFRGINRSVYADRSVAVDLIEAARIFWRSQIIALV